MKGFIVCLLTLATLSSCSQDATPMATQEQNPAMTAYETSLASLPTIVKSDTGFSECMQRSANMCISNTVLTQVRESRDISLCDSLLDAGIKSSCRQTTITLNAREKEDPTICDALGKDSTGCKQEVLTQKAVSSKKVELCSDVMSLFSDEKENVPTGLDNPSKADRAFDSCVIQIISGSSKSDPKVCDIMKSQIQKEMCKMILREKGVVSSVIPEQPVKTPSSTTASSTTTASSAVLPSRPTTPVENQPTTASGN